MTTSAHSLPFEQPKCVTVNEILKWNVLIYFPCIVCKYQILILFSRTPQLGLHFFLPYANKIVAVETAQNYCAKWTWDWHIFVSTAILDACAKFFAYLLLRCWMTVRLTSFVRSFNNLPGGLANACAGLSFWTKRRFNRIIPFQKIINMFSTNKNHGVQRRTKSHRIKLLSFRCTVYRSVHFDDDFDGHSLSNTTKSNWLLQTCKTNTKMYPLNGKAGKDKRRN